MRQTKSSAPRRKQSGGSKKRTSKPTTKPTEPRYININTPPLEKKAVLIWLIITALMAVVIVCWFLSLSGNIANETKNLNLEQIKKEIDSALGKFDLSGNIASTTPLISPEDLAAIKENVIKEIKQNEPELWPERTSAVLGLTFRLPPNWQMDESQNTLRLTDYDLTGTIPESFTLITVTAQSDNRKQSLFSWFSRNKIDLKDYSLDETSLNSTSTAVLYYTRTTPVTGEIDRRVYLKTADKVYEIQVLGRGEDAVSNQIVNLIISSIELI
ncbi:MAG: hypothetical protein WC668_00750 [Patescibacteria group bacterium]|jgi:hypothetical protein